MRTSEEYLSKRMQQVMEVLYREGKVTATDLEQMLPGNPTNSTVRSHLRVLEQRGHVGHEEVEGKFIYFATHTRPAAAKSALQKLLDIFFGGSAEAAVAALLDRRDRNLTDEELERIGALIEAAKKGETR